MDSRRPVTAPARSGRAVLAPGVLSLCKDHRQGRTSSLRCLCSTLTLIFPGKTLAPIGRTDRTRLVPLRPGTYQEDGLNAHFRLEAVTARSMDR